MEPLKHPTHILLWIVFLITVNLAREAVAKPPLGKKWPVAQQVSFDEIHHSSYSTLLKKYVDENGYVNYGAWQKNQGDRQALQDYLRQLSRASLDKSSSKEAEIAFWINAYNAVTLEGILQVYPTSSIRNHTAKLFGYNIWKQLPLIVGTRQFSLDQIEHEILRKKNEPRIHFAIVCASVGCPRLLNKAYTAQNLETQLAGNARDFFSREKNFRYEDRSETVYLSSILDWFGSDFGENTARQLQYLRPYLPDNLTTKLKPDQVKVRYLDYDWTLNDQARLK